MRLMIRVRSCFAVVSSRWVELPAVFLLHTRHAHHTPHLLLAGAVAQQHRQELADIKPIGLGPALAPIDLNTGGIDDVILAPMRS